MKRTTSPTLDAETAEDRSIRLMADEAEKLGPKFERLQSAVYQVLSNNGIQDARRTKYFGAIMKLLRAREAARERENKLADEALAADKREQMIRDAYAHELRQPPDTYDPEAEEQARRAIR